MSTVRMPCRAAVIGPMVDPHGIALFETNDWNGTPAARRRGEHGAAPMPSVA